MKDIGEWLKEVDPLAHEPGLSDDEVQRLRKSTLAAVSVEDPTTTRVWDWPRPLVVALTVVFTLAAATLIGRRLPPPRRDAPADRGQVSEPIREAALPEPVRRQLQFATPGGTRIIWVFDPNFKLQGR
jgi:hypothetical protein